MGKINVGIVDDNQDFIKNLTTYLNRTPDIFVVSAAMTKQQALKLSEINNIDIILIDVNLTENKCDGILIANQIATNLKNTKIIMLSNYNDKELIQNSLLAGAAYYVLKTNFKLLPGIIRQINNNELPLQAIIRDYSDLTKESILKSKFLLSDTEITIYKLAEEGNTQAIIVDKLHISESTYKKHINNILKKIKATSIKKAVDIFKTSFFVKEIENYKPFNTLK